jgi:hypothetical protein
MSDRRHHPCFDSCEEEIAELSAYLEYRSDRRHRPDFNSWGEEDADLEACIGPDDEELSHVAATPGDGPARGVLEALRRVLDRIAYLRGGDRPRAEEGRP